MKKLLVMLMISVMATSAFAVIDDDPDMLGVYFDSNGDVNELAADPNVPFNAYVMITNPSESSVWGLECGYDIVVPVGFENLWFRLGNSLPGGAVDLGTSTDKASGDYVVGLASPLPGQPATTFVTWQLMILAPMQMEIYLGPSQVESIQDGLPAYEYGGAIKSLGLSTGGPGIPVAVVNGAGPVSVEETTFGGVKSLFR